MTERRGEVFGTKERHCHWCLGEIMSTVPCEGCSYAWYCSIRAELRAPGVMRQLALRVVLKAGLKEILKMRTVILNKSERRRA